MNSNEDYGHPLFALKSKSKRKIDYGLEILNNGNWQPTFIWGQLVWVRGVLAEKKMTLPHRYRIVKRITKRTATTADIHIEVLKK